MAKKKAGLVRLVSTAGTGVFYVAKTSGKKTEKLSFRKYDKKVRKHVVFKESKIS